MWQYKWRHLVDKLVTNASRATWQFFPGKIFSIAPFNNMQKCLFKYIIVLRNLNVVFSSYTAPGRAMKLLLDSPDCWSLKLFVNSNGSSVFERGTQCSAPADPLITEREILLHRGRPACYGPVHCISPPTSTVFGRVQVEVSSAENQGPCPLGVIMLSTTVSRNWRSLGKS